MSKKHFIALAKALAGNKPADSKDIVGEMEYRIANSAKIQWERDVERVADVCSAMSPNFDYQTFRDACGLNT